MVTSRPAHTSLLIDLYQLTMAHAYLELGMNEVAVFELFVRQLPPTRGFLIAAGLAQALEYLQQLRFGAEEIEYLRTLDLFPESFLSHLRELRFSGAVHAMPEGTPFFAQEPILRITAPIIEAQLVESRLLNIMHFQSVIASKAARFALAAGGRQLVDFGMRRAHEADAGLYAARAAFLGGFDATATVEAGQRFGIPLSGTMAHSFIEAHDHELDALRGFVAAYGGAATLLIDTYDSTRAARRVAALARELQTRAPQRRIRAVRIDSGDLAQQCRAVRAVLDEEGCRDIQIVVSGGLDEHAVKALIDGGAPVDAFGIGTALDAATDAPALDMAYKLQQYAGRPRRKRSPGKATWPGIKQVFRERDARGEILSDAVALEIETVRGEPLLQQVMATGRRVMPGVALAQSRAHCARELRALPTQTQALAGHAPFPVRVSAAIQDLAAQLDARLE
jgi:nicotinate phosphoribosyltransferase